jgi:hypothetical protein
MSEPLVFWGGQNCVTTAHHTGTLWHHDMHEGCHIGVLVSLRLANSAPALALFSLVARAGVIVYTLSRVVHC